MLRKVLKRIAKHRSQYYKDRLFRRVNEKGLEVALESVGVTSGATLYIQSSFGSLGYYPDGMQRFIALLQRIVGASGTIAMPCFPFGGSMQDYVASLPVFDVRQSPSAIGKLPEVVRLMANAKRSCHPTHPVVAVGKRADWLCDGHEVCLSPQGDGSPFDKLVQCGALILRINTPAYPLCHRLQEIVAWPNLFLDDPATLTCIDHRGRELAVTTRIYRKKIPFVMFLSGTTSEKPVAMNIIDFPVIAESRERKYGENPDKAAVLQQLHVYRHELEFDGTRRRTVFNDCPIDSLLADRSMDFAVATATPLIEKFRDSYDVESLTARMASGQLTI